MARDKKEESSLTLGRNAKKARQAREAIGPREYQALAEFRYLLRKFLAFSKAAAEESGLTTQQHQALLVIKGFGGESGLTIGEIANRLLIRHHSAVELVDRLVGMGLARRTTDPTDRRRVRVMLAAKAEARLRDLSAAHLAEIRAAKPALTGLLANLKGQ
jgi:DNA-binding MarR family transcriptional regulator